MANGLTATVFVIDAVDADVDVLDTGDSRGPFT